MAFPGAGRGGFVIGVDFGTLSGRAVVVRVEDGAELASASTDYPHGVLDRALPDGRPLAPEWALQVPGDYLEVLRRAVPEAVRRAGIDSADVIGIGTDFTACTMVPATSDGTPLCDLPEWVGEPHAYVKLWKHHAAQGQADRINAQGRERGESWLARYGGFISSEWEFAKGLQLLEEAPAVYAAMDRWVEAADWIVWQLCGRYVRNACTAGYKGIRQDGAYPSPDFLGGLNPAFADFVEAKLDQPIGQLGELAGRLSARGAELTGLPTGIAVAVGNVDAHVTVPADYQRRADERGLSLHELLTELASGQPIGGHGLMALDWHSGNRSVLVDHDLSGLVLGLSLTTQPEDVYRALIEATAFGTRRIIDSFVGSGVPVAELVVAGGLVKNAFLMQLYSDVTNLPISTITSEQGPALGSAIHAAVAAQAYDDVAAAAKAMGGRELGAYRPRREAVAAYDRLYGEYLTLHDHFGRGGNDVMHRLKAIRREVLGAAAGDVFDRLVRVEATR